MHRLSSSFVLGYHGCAEDVAASLIDGSSFRPSTNEYDWLGHGIYFWENDPDRALDWVTEKLRQTDATARPAVVGAVIDLGLCLDVTTQAAIDSIRRAHEQYLALLGAAGEAAPRNDGGPDRLMRKLDCAVINFIHTARIAAREPPIDTVKGVFIEGSPIYPDAGFHLKTHIQIAVRNTACIKGVFRPR